MTMTAEAVVPELADSDYERVCWRLAGFVNIATGEPYSVTFNSTVTGWPSNRADIVGDPKLDNPTVERWFNTDAGFDRDVVPERRRRPVDHRADIFGFGATLYEMLSGKRAFKRDTMIETMNAILKDEPPELDVETLHVSPGLERVVRHCLEKKPGDRFQSARDLAFALGAPASTAASPAVQAPAAARRSWIRIALLADLHRAIDEDLDKCIPAKLAGYGAIVSIRRYKCRQIGNAAIREQFGNLTDPAYVLLTVIRGKAQVFIESMADIVAVKNIGMCPPLVKSHFCGDGQG